MKRLKLFLLLVMGVVFFTGCAVKQDYYFKIHNDKSMDVQFIMAVDDELIDFDIASWESEQAGNNNAGQQVKKYTDQERWNHLEATLNGQRGNSQFFQLKKAGYSYEKYNENGLKGYIFKKTFENIDTMAKYDTKQFKLEQFTKVGESQLFSKKLGTYRAEIKIADTQSTTESTMGNVRVDSKVVVELDGKAGKNNATNVSDDGKKLTWDLNELDGKVIYFEFQLPMTFSFIIIIVAFVIFILGVCYFVLQKGNIIEKLKDKFRKN